MRSECQRRIAQSCSNVHEQEFPKALMSERFLIFPVSNQYQSREGPVLVTYGGAHDNFFSMHGSHLISSKPRIFNIATSFNSPKQLVSEETARTVC